MTGKKLQATFDLTGYMPRAIVPALFVKAHDFTEKLETGFHQLRRSVPEKPSARPRGLRWDILALTPNGEVQLQPGGIPNQVPSGSLVATVGTFVRKSSDIVFNGDKSFIALHRNRRFPRAIVTAQVYKWVLGGDYPAIYEGLTLQQLDALARILKEEGLPLPLPTLFAARLKAATAESLQRRVVIAATNTRGSS